MRSDRVGKAPLALRHGPGLKAGGRKRAVSGERAGGPRPVTMDFEIRAAAVPAAAGH
jgi:hypothetical protein